MRYYRCVLLIAVSVGLLSCATSTTRRIEVGRELVSDPTSISVQDFETIAQHMARSMLGVSVIQRASEPPTVAFLSVENRSNDFIDKRAFLEKMRTLLMKHSDHRMVFLDRHHFESLEQERDAKEAGRVTSSGQTELLGADYFLTGVISSINAAGGSEKTIFRRYSFRLTDAHTSAIVWEDEYETQLYHRRGMIYR